MARPPHAREKLLDAFEEILVTDTERAATMEAVAKAAGVSKGGLLYHFPSKQALEQGILDRLARTAEEDVEEMLAHPGGAVDAFIRSSGGENTPLDRVMIATVRLAGNGSAEAAAAIDRVRQTWRDVLRPFVRSEAALALVMLVADGVYFNATLQVSGDASGMFGSLPELTDLDELIAIVRATVDPA